MKFSIFKNRSELPRRAQKELRPRKEFLERGRERFLAAFDASPLTENARVSTGAHGTAVVPPVRSRTAMFAKLAVGIVAVLCVAAGFSVYADTANVPVTSPLYPWKRLGENVQLALAVSAEQKAQLQATFAVRRAQEIRQLNVSHPSSTLIPQLTEQMDGDISSSLSVTPVINNDRGSNDGNGRSHGLGPGEGTGIAVSSTLGAAASSEGEAPSGTVMSVYCTAFNANISGLFIGHLEAGLATHPGAVEEFNRLCGGQDTAPGTSTATSTVSPPPAAHGDGASGGDGVRASASASATSSVIIGGDAAKSVTNINENINTHNGDGGGEKQRHWSDGSSSADVTTSVSGTSTSNSTSVHVGF